MHVYVSIVPVTRTEGMFVSLCHILFVAVFEVIVIYMHFSANLLAIKYTICLNCCSTLCFIGNTFHNLKTVAGDSVS